MAKTIKRVAKKVVARVRKAKAAPVKEVCSDCNGTGLASAHAFCAKCGGQG